ncbi:15536_t:CDS:2, partial [Dentiscutata heterogama]
AKERAFQAERHIILQSRKINFGKLANIKVTKVNNAKFTKKERSQKKVSIKNIDTLQNDKSKRNCFKCGKPGHFARNCYSNTKKDSFNNVNNWKLKKKRFCSQCGKPYPKHHPGSNSKSYALATSLANAQDSIQRSEQNKFELEQDKKSNRSTKKNKKKASKDTKISKKILKEYLHAIKKYPQQKPKENIRKPSIRNSNTNQINW